MLLLSEQHTGESFYDEVEAAQFVEDHIGVFLSTMTAASAAGINLIDLIITLRTQWLATPTASPHE